MPTRKWISGTLIGIVGIVVMLVTGDTDHFTDTEKIAVATFLTQRIGSYFTPNESTATGDGVPHKH